MNKATLSIAEHSGAIAIVGMAGRFPGAESIKAFWRNLCNGVDSISHFKLDELDDHFDAATRNDADFVSARPILKDVDRFDAEFFGMLPRDAALTDPQHRVFLECCWEALEDAGCDPARFAGAIGVFAGCSMNTYFLNNVCADRATIEAFTSGFQIDNYPMLVGAGPEFLATKVAYKLDLRGPAVAVQSACSTSLLAVAQACQSLQLYQSDLALAGGVSISFPQQRGYLHQAGGMVSADGRCRSFDAEASGTVFGSGAGAVLLKRLDEALADGDCIYAVIRGCGVNNDGGDKLGYTAPSVDGQARAIEAALANADVDARSISYVECHGTATPLGDPVEIAGLTQAYRGETADCQFCAIGSVKSNVGHLDAAAGIAGLIKAALALQHRRLPASLHYERPNPAIDFPNTPFYVNASLKDWTTDGSPRRAGVSAFGVGGTNVHVILEEAPPAVEASPKVAVPLLFVTSARSNTALEQVRARLAARLRDEPDLDLAAVASTLMDGRHAFTKRSFVVAAERDALIAALEQVPVRGHAGSISAQTPEVLFMFPGQGAQFAGMGHGLYVSDPEFRADIDECVAVLRPKLGFDLREVMFGDDPTALTPTRVAQPALFTIGYALARKWQRLGVEPTAMIGHSVGEFVAATLASVMTLEDALEVIAERALLMQTLPAGGMLAVRLDESALALLLEAPLAIAAINAPKLCVVAGPIDALERFETLLDQKDIPHRRLSTSHAFHSPMVDPIVAPLQAKLSRIPLRAPNIPCLSCVTGTWLTPELATSPAYWARHAREPVRFADALTRLLQDRSAESTALVEVGPGNSLISLARQIAPISSAAIASLPGNTADAAASDFLNAAGKLWLRGVALASHGGHRHVTLPTYPFERQRHWIEAPPTGSGLAVSANPVAMTSNPVATAKEDFIMNTANVSRPTTTLVDDRRSRARQAVIGILEALSGADVATDGSDPTFLEMGFDSLFLSQVAQKLKSQLKVSITFRQLLGDLCTVDRLASFIAESMPAPVATAATANLVSSPTAVLDASAAAVPGDYQSLFQDQLRAMSQLINQQLAALQGLPASASTPIAQSALPERGALPAAAPSETPASRFEVFQVKATSATPGGPTPQQQHFIEALIARYVAKTPGSKAQTQRDRAVLADPRVAAGFRSEWKEMVYPIVCTRSKGSKLWDVDGNVYVDLLNGFGQTAFGHSPDFVTEAVHHQIDEGFIIGPQAALAGEVATLFCELTGNERMTFCNTGSEAVMAALRIARAVTGRETVVVFSGAYHGQFDEVLVKGLNRPGTAPRAVPAAVGIPDSAVQNMVVLDYGSDMSLEWIRANADTLAAIVVEPVQSRRADFQPFEFLRALREITLESGTAFIMDEVVTGFRTHPGGMQTVLGIRADLATYGKVVGGGLPIGILAGKAQFMDALDGGWWTFGDESYPPAAVTFFAGTFVRHPLALAAAGAVLRHLKAEGPGLQQRLSDRTAALVADLRDLFAAAGLTARIGQYASFFYFNLHDDPPLASLLYYLLRQHGVHIQEGFPCFLTTAHTDADIDLLRSAFRDSLAELLQAGILPGAASVGNSATGSVEGELLLTENQTEIWLAAQFGDEASCAFNESVTLRFEGTVDETALRTALDMLVERHDALRLRFSATGEKMWVSAPEPLAITVMDATEAKLADAIDADAAIPFDLVAGPPLRATWARLTPTRHALILTAHHIVCDGWSFNVLIEEFSQLYPALLRKESLQLPAPLAFSRYAVDSHATDADAERTETFWLDQFKSSLPVLELPTDRPRAAIRSFSGGTRSRTLDAATYRALKAAGARAGCTLFVTLLGAFHALMGRFAEQDDVVVGVPTAGQSLLEDETLVGHCVNFLPIRASWNDATIWTEHLATVNKAVLAAHEHPRYTLGTLVRKLAPPRQASRLPLAEIQFNLERLASRIELPGAVLNVSPNPKAYVNFDLFLNVIESDDGLRMDCDYNSDLWESATIDGWLDAYCALLEAMVGRMDRRIWETPCLSPATRESLLQPTVETPVPKVPGIHSLVEAAAARQPEAIAIRHGGQFLRYRELDARANQLAHELIERVPRAAGGEPSIIAVCVSRSIGMVSALLAVLKAGHAYLPLDPTHPASRRQRILDDAGAALLIVDTAAKVDSGGLPTLNLDSDAGRIADWPKTPAAISIGDNALAYMIYTSGSTGIPKGVRVPHPAVINLLTSMARQPGFTREDRMLAVTTPAFDISVLELFLPLICGGELVLATSEEIRDGFLLRERIEDSSATVMQATPSTWDLLLEAGFRPMPGFRMLCGGEALTVDLAKRLLHTGNAELWNMYGPTETTIWSACKRIELDNGPITVGKPIANTSFHVLDRHDQPTAPGVPGQLHIGGAGVALGYHHRDELSAERFIANPLGAGRLYRTGDVVRRLASGEFQVAGRNDQQIKLRGYRIELGEIETALLREPGVTGAVVLLRNDVAADPRLVAYLTGTELTPGRLRTRLASDLPDYMVPVGWVMLDAFPRLPNGKLDRSAFPAPGAAAPKAPKALPAGPLEERLTRIWTQVLQQAVGRDDDLLELGADSIMLFRIVSRSVAEDLPVSAKILLETRSIAELARRLSEGLVAPSVTAPRRSLRQFRDAQRKSSLIDAPQ